MSSHIVALHCRASRGEVPLRGASESGKKTEYEPSKKMAGEDQNWLATVKHATPKL